MERRVRERVGLWSGYSYIKGCVTCAFDTEFVARRKKIVAYLKLNMK